VITIRQMVPQSTTCCAKHYTDSRPATQPPPPCSGCPWGKWGQHGAQGLKHRGWGPRQCNTEGAREVRQTNSQIDKQTNFSCTVIRWRK